MKLKQDITSVLKGFAILAVLINHYVTLYIAPRQTEYANGIIAIFFVLSGYGIFYSLSKYQSFHLGTLKDFFVKRFIKIYPLYWLSLLIYFNLRPDIFPQHPIRVALALPFFQAPQLYWFITSLMQCYLLAPCLYLVLKKIGLKKYLILLVVLIFASYFLFPLTTLSLSRKYFVYRYIFLGHIFLFALGLAIPSLLKLKQQYTKYSKFLLNNIISAIALIAFLTLVYYTRFPATGKILAPFFVIFASVFCFILIYNNTKLPNILNQSLTFLGINSYSLYLFHLIYYKLLERSDLFTHSIPSRVTLTIIVLPGFLLACILLEKLNNVVAQYCFAYLNINRRKST